MEKDEHGRRLAAAMAARRLDRAAVAQRLDRNVRTVTNWTSGRTLPSQAERSALRDLLGDYDNPGDPVEVAIFNSGLTDDRQYDVVGYYKRRLREQEAERAAVRSVPSSLDHELDDVDVSDDQQQPTFGQRLDLEAARRDRRPAPGSNGEGS